MKKETTAQDTVVNESPKQQAIVVPKKSPRKIHLKEFIAGKNLKREFVAGFKMYLNGVEFMTDSEWENTFNEYNTRK